MRRELGQNVRDSQLEDLQLRYDVAVDDVETLDGINPGIFDAVIPTATLVE